MEAAIIFAIVFIPFFLFVLLAYRVGKKMPESAIAHLESKVYRFDKKKSNLIEGGVTILFIGVGLIMLFGITILLLFADTDPLYIRPGVKEALVLIYFIAVLPLALLILLSWIHNGRRMNNVVLDLEPGEGLIGWETEEVRFDLTKEDFVHINTIIRYGRLPVSVSEYLLRSGESLYLTHEHPGKQALLSMLKGVPGTVREYNFPVVPTRLPKLLSVGLKAFDWMKRNHGYEVLGILFSLIAIYALYYYEENQRNLHINLPAKELTVVGDHIQKGTRGRLRYYLWLNDGNRIVDIRVPKRLYHAGIESRSLVLYYNRGADRYVYQVSDFGFNRFVQWVLGAMIVFLIGRTIWLSRKTPS